MPKKLFPVGAKWSSVRHEGDFEQNGGRSLPPFQTRELTLLHAPPKGDVPLPVTQNYGWVGK